MGCLAKLDKAFRDPWDFVSIMMERNEFPSGDVHTKGKHAPVNSKFIPQGISGVQNNRCFPVNVIPGVLFNSEEREQQTRMGGRLERTPLSSTRGRSQSW